MPDSAFEKFCQEHLSELDGLARSFSDYQPVPVNIARLRLWLEQFNAQHRILALKLATIILYYAVDRLNGVMPNLYALIKQQIAQERAKPADVFYVPWGRTGESGGHIARCFRLVNKLQKSGDRFIEKAEIPGRTLHLDNPVVFFLDDFVGTGKQVCDGWRDSISQIVPERVKAYLAVVAAFKEGVSRIESETPLSVLAVHNIGPRFQLMESACTSFSGGDKNTIRRYCVNAGNQPLGFGERGLLVSFAYGTPNNTISAIRGSEKQHPWKGLLPSWEDL
jgi:hypothetical protein